MKNSIKTLLLGVATLCAVTSCKDSDITSPIPSKDAIGKVSVKLTTLSDYLQRSTSQADEIPLDDFVIRINDAQGNEVVNETYGEIDPILGLTVGDGYTLIAEGGVNEVAAFTSPYYYGEANFSVFEDRINTVNVTSKVVNTKVSLLVTEPFRATYGEDWDVTIRNEEYNQQGDPELVYTVENEEVAGYFRPSTLFVTIRGAAVQKTFEVTDVKAGDHHILMIGVTQSGQAQLNVLVDCTLNDKKVDLNIPTDDETLGNGGAVVPPFVTPGTGEEGGEEEEVLPAPTVVGEGFDMDEVVNINKSEAIPNVVVNIDAPAGISELWVTIESDELSGLLPALFGGDTFDLANPTADQLTNLVQFQILKEGEVVRGATQFVFDVTPFMSLLGENNGNPHIFKIRAVDANANEAAKSLTVSITE